jgi:hypothetical protein
MKSVGASGSGSGAQRNWSGVTGPVSEIVVEASVVDRATRTVPCIAAGRIRYSQLRRFGGAAR